MRLQAHSHTISAGDKLASVANKSLVYVNNVLVQDISLFPRNSDGLSGWILAILVWNGESLWQNVLDSLDLEVLLGSHRHLDESELFPMEDRHVPGAKSLVTVPELLSRYCLRVFCRKWLFIIGLFVILEAGYKRSGVSM